MSRIVNPFEGQSGPSISLYTAQEIATLQSRLNKRLGPEFISARPGASGSKVHYLAADKCINLANEVFGFNGWSSAIQNIQVDFVDENAQNGKISLGMSVIMRVTLKDGTFHEDIGYGHIENCRGKAAAFEKAKKEGTTDALKRTLRNFGNVLGNCLYDKDFLSKVTKLKAAPMKWDINNLHRHSDYATVKKEASGANDGTHLRAIDSKTDSSEAEFEDDFDGDLFDEADFSERRSGEQEEEATEQQAPSRSIKAPPSLSPSETAALTLPPIRRLPPNGGAGSSNPVSAVKSMPPPIQRPQSNNSNSSFPSQPSAHFQPQPSVPAVPPVVQAQHQSTTPQHPLPPTSFFSARSIESTGAIDLPSTATVTANPVSHAPFNIHAESPSIRKTVGFDHRKSAPVPKKAIHASSTMISTSAPHSTSDSPLPSVPLPGHHSTNLTTTTNTSSHVNRDRDFINPAMDSNRKIGAPSPGPPYRLPGKRPLGDATNVPAPPRGEGVAGGVKRVKGEM